MAEVLTTVIAIAIGTTMMATDIIAGDTTEAHLTDIRVLLVTTTMVVASAVRAGTPCRMAYVNRTEDTNSAI